MKSLLRRQGITVRSVSEPVDTDTAHGKLIEGILESMDEFYSANLATETKRGQVYAAKCGYWTGGPPPFGYDLKQIPDPKGRTTKHGQPVMRTILEPNKAQAEVVRYLFDLAAKGSGLRNIAASLNAQGYVSAKRGNGFDPSSIHCILRNEIYIGNLIYNRRTFSKKPDGKKSKRYNPRSEWTIEKLEHLRLVDQTTWDRVQAWADGPRAKGSPFRTAFKYPYSSLLRCEHCGAAMTAIKNERKGHTYVKYTCSYNHRRGPTVCPNNVNIDHVRLNRAIMGAILNHVLSEASVRKIVSMVEEIIERSHDGNPGQQEAAEEQKQELDRQIARLTQAIAGAGDITELVRDLREKSRHREAVEQRLAGIKDLERKELPADLDREVRKRLKNVWQLLHDSEAQVIREELRRHIVKLTADNTGLVKIEGTLSGALALSLVAGTGFEPVTSRL